jgi:hypothetical protein
MNNIAGSCSDSVKVFQNLCVTLEPTPAQPGTKPRYKKVTVTPPR